MLRKQCELTMATTVRACRGEVLEGGRRSGVAVLHEIPAEPRLWRAGGAGETAGDRIASSIPYTLCESLLAHDRLAGIWGMGGALALGWIRRLYDFLSTPRVRYGHATPAFLPGQFLKTWRFMELRIYDANSHAISWQGLAGEKFELQGVSGSTL